ncbi:hypothetical protein Tco_0907085 [Tanacetum coccineum]|uniref:Uncharacterized protein n=1 Tax=Tanacetum coccineum TaxID=301880 RepID=A0ABQ5CIM1_9ASTR
MLEDFSSNGKGKRTETYTILFLELKILNVFAAFCSLTIQLYSLSPKELFTSREVAFRRIRIRHDQLVENAVSSKSRFPWIPETHVNGTL